MTKIKQLEFSGLYLGPPNLGGWFCDVPGARLNPLPADAALQADLEQLISVCHAERNKAPSVGQFKIRYDDVDYRACVMQVLAGEVFVLRKVASLVSSLAELRIPQPYVRQMMAKDLSGLFVISGPMKAGKTTTACTLLKDRLTAYGGVAVTGEDPIELPLEGIHGQGVCFQTTALRDARSFVDGFRHLMRCGARMVLIDEIRDPESAAELLQASLNGHLIITTLCADNVTQALTKLHALAADMLAAGRAPALMADGLVGVLHQQMLRAPNHGVKLETEFLFLKEAPLTKALLRKGEYEQLGAHIRQQMAAMINENAVAMRFSNG